MALQSKALQDATRLAYALSQSLASCADPRTVSRVAKIPFKALLLREFLAYRVAEVSTSACDLFSSGRTIAATILTRSAIEGIAWLLVLDWKIRKALQENAVGTTGDFIDRLLLGSRAPDAEHTAYNVLNAIDEVDKRMPGFRAIYDTCSEFAHPNADGMMHSYGRPDHETLIFNLDPKAYQVPVDGIAPFLAGGLDLFIDTYNGMPPHLEKFARLCEGELNNGES